MRLLPYYEGDGVTLYCGRALEVLNHLSVQAAVILADPPYGETSLDWDRWPGGWPERLRRYSNQLWCFGSMRMFWNHWGEFAGWKLAQDVVWEKHNGSNLRRDRFRRVHELALHFYQGKWGSVYKSSPCVSTHGGDRPRQLIRGKKPAHWGGIEIGGGYEYRNERLARSVMAIRSCHGHAVNETQKPVELVKNLLRFSVPEGGIVLDPFAGSGTTLLAARELGLRSVGIEMRESQCLAAVRRLTSHLKNA